MTTSVLEEFRRRFTAAILSRQSTTSDKGGLFGVDSVEANDRVLILGPNAADVLQAAARRAGPGSEILNVDTDPIRVVELRNQITCAQDLEAEASIRCLCADWSDLRINLEWAQQSLQEEPVNSRAALLRFNEKLLEQARKNPMIRDGCVNRAILTSLNSVPHEQVVHFLHEIMRCLQNCGRLTLSCLVSDEVLPAEEVTPATNYRPTEQQLLNLLEQVGFYGIELTRWAEAPHRVIQTVEIRRVAVQAFKGKQGPCYECHHAVIYRGPWRQVRDDDGHVYKRGERTAVCEKTYRLLTREPYQDDFIPLPPYIAVPVEQSIPFDCNGVSTRDPKVTKGLQSNGSQTQATECSSNCAC